MNRYQHTADTLASKGRYGDDHLLHVSGDELRGIAALGPLTINPETGLPEAFSLKGLLKTALPIAAAVFAPVALPALAPALAGVSPALLSGLGSGLATTALTGDIKRGLVSGVMGASFGSAFGKAGEAVAGQAAGGSSAYGDIASKAANDMGLGQAAANAVSSAPVSGGIASLSMGERLAAPFTEAGGKAFMGQATSRGTMIPFAMGGLQLSQWDMEDQSKKLRKKQEQESEEEQRQAREWQQLGYRTAQPYAATGPSPYRMGMSYNTPQYMAEGGTVKGDEIAAKYPWLFGGQFGMPYMGNMGGYGGIDPVTVQKNLRGNRSVAPRGNYMPGFNPEFQYFQDDPDNVQQAPATYANTWARMYARDPISRRFMDMPVRGGPQVQPVASKPYFESILQASAKEGEKKMAEGGAVPLDTSMGRVSVPAGGIANIPTQQAPQQPDPQDLQMVASAIMGRSEQPDQIIQAFIGKYGVDMFRAVRDMILKSVNPNAQTEGMIEGPGGGMDDQVPGTIGDQQAVAVSPGEYIVPADVVSGLGDGSSEAGSQELDQMAQNVRMARGGTTTQPPPLDARRLLPR